MPELFAGTFGLVEMFRWRSMTELFGLGMSHCVLDVVTSGEIPCGAWEDAPLHPPIFKSVKIGEEY